MIFLSSWGVYPTANAAAMMLPTLVPANLFTPLSTPSSSNTYMNSTDFIDLLHTMLPELFYMDLATYFQIPDAVLRNFDELRNFGFNSNKYVIFCSAIL